MLINTLSNIVRHVFIRSHISDDESLALRTTSYCSLMLLVADLANTKGCKKAEKWLRPRHMGTHLRVLSESYVMNTNMIGFRPFSKALYHCALDKNTFSIGRVNALSNIVRNVVIHYLLNNVDKRFTKGPIFLTTRVWRYLLHRNPHAAGGWFGQYKMMQNTEKWPKPWNMGTQWELSNEYQFSKIFASLYFERK